MTTGEELTAFGAQDSLGMGNDVDVARARADQPHVIQHVHRAIFEHDVLSMIFDVFDLEDEQDRATCARSSRVCRAWTEPALRVLWSGTRWNLMRLCAALLKTSERKGLKKGFTSTKASAQIQYARWTSH